MSPANTLESRVHARDESVDEGPLTLRPAECSDLPLLVDLFRHRDGAVRDADYVRRAFLDLDPARCISWIALVGDTPVGMSTVYLRTIQQGDTSWRAAYWGPLYVRPEYRHRMIYPSLPRAKFRALRALGLDFVYAAIRHPRLAAGHLQLGFRKLADMPVLAKPLRPVSLLVRHKGWPAWLEWLGRPVDVLYQAYLQRVWARSAATGACERLAWDSPELADVAHAWHEPAAATVGQRWTADRLRERYATPAKDVDYALSVRRCHGRPTAAAVYRVEQRGALRAGVLLDLAAAGDLGSAGRVLSAAEHALAQAGCQVLLALDAPGLHLGPLLRRSGYLASGESYMLMILPLRKPDPERPSPTYDGSQWRYSWADHDTF
jgi:hypothetical protein